MANRSSSDWFWVIVLALFVIANLVCIAINLAVGGKASHLLLNIGAALCCAYGGWQIWRNP